MPSSDSTVMPLPGGIAVQSRTLSETRMPRIIYNRLLGGWFIVRGPHQTPIGGRFESRAAALAHLTRRA